MITVLRNKTPRSPTNVVDSHLGRLVSGSKGLEASSYIIIIFLASPILAVISSYIYS